MCIEQVGLEQSNDMKTAVRAAKALKPTPEEIKKKKEAEEAEKKRLD